MNKPKSVVFAGKKFWDCSTEYLVEYALWLHGGPIGLTELQKKLQGEWLPDCQHPNVYKRLVDLIDAGKAVKLKRGLYIHKTAMDIFS